MFDNAFFNLKDQWADNIEGYAIPPEWWSRLYEYPWAIRYAKPGMTVADMGCGWEQRPFKDMLSKVCHKVYAVDQHWEAGKLTPHENMEFVIADFTQHIPAIQDESLDTVFCISVLEELDGRLILSGALGEFYRCLKYGGIAVITCDVKYDIDKPHGPFGDVDLRTLFKEMIEVGFKFKGDIDLSKDDLVFNEAFNLCVFHCVAEKQ